MPIMLVVSFGCPFLPPLLGSDNPPHSSIPETFSYRLAAGSISLQMTPDFSRTNGVVINSPDSLFTKQLPGVKFIELSLEHQLINLPASQSMADPLHLRLGISGTTTLSVDSTQLNFQDMFIEYDRDQGWQLVGKSQQRTAEQLIFRFRDVMLDHSLTTGVWRMVGTISLSDEIAERLGFQGHSDVTIGQFSIQAILEPLDALQTPDYEGNQPPAISTGGHAASSGPDVILAELVGAISYGSNIGLAAFSVGTTSCNAGDTNLLWIASTNQHPVIAQNMFRLNNGRFEQIGQSWLKHGFAALTGNACGFGCQNPGTLSLLGVGCSDPYSASLNGSQTNLGAKSEVNAYTGFFSFPRQLNPAITATVGRRLQIPLTDLDPALNLGAIFVVEGQYVTPDDAGAGHQNNNASYRRATISLENGVFILRLIDSTERTKPAIRAWKALQPTVIETDIQIPDDGLLILAADVTDLGNGMWHYEYAVQNLNSHRSVGAFEIPITAGASVSNIDFHAVRYHSGEIYNNLPWIGVRGGSSVRWETQSSEVESRDNALRWGTLYNFRFDADVGPQDGLATLDLYRPGTPDSVLASTVVPITNAADCNNNGIADSVDIDNGRSLDCNENNIPDECEPLVNTPLTTIQVASGLSSPIYLTSPPGDTNRMFIVQQGGIIKILSAGAILETPFIDLSSVVLSSGERGLLSMAFDPNYTLNGQFFVNYTNLNGDTVIARYTVSSSPNIANAASGLVLKTITQDFANHNGGQLQFGPDGFLYIGMGDGGSSNDPFNRAQDGSTLLGKMLRLDVDNPPNYIPSTNPYNNSGLPLDEIWSMGLRNPWRFSFDRSTGDLYIADVGQNEFEEIDFQPFDSLGGENYGWRCFEAYTCTNQSGCNCTTNDFTPPILAYDHSQSDCSITGGYVYRGCAIDGLSGTYFYADFCSGRIASFRYDGGLITDELDRTLELTPPTGPINNIASFGEDAEGELYIISLSGGVYKIVSAGDPVCGNNLLEVGEDCDDGNVIPGDGCDELCRFESALAFDNCINAAQVQEDTMVFTNIKATTDGPDEILTCAFETSTQIESDLWYCYTPTCSGTATISVCDSDFDTRLAVYPDCVCPTEPAAVACNDDFCGLQSQISLAVSACEPILIRLGGFGTAQGTGNLTITCTPDPVLLDCNENGIDDSVDIACETSFDGDGNGIPDECEIGGSFTRGGKLYDQWWLDTGTTPPTTDHPLWAFRPDSLSNPRLGADTWRCKECHGWDYKGADGRYGVGDHRTGFPGILGTTLSVDALTTLLTQPPSINGSPGVLNGHDYGSILSELDIVDLVSFVKIGLIDDDQFIEPTSARFLGDPDLGEVHYTMDGSTSCIICHGANGTAINFGTLQNPEFLGTVAVRNPWEFIHKARVGQPGAPMPSWLADGGTNQGTADIGRYVQLNFPVECTVDENCNDGIDCTVDICNPSGNCLFIPDDSRCGSDGLFCNGVEFCDLNLGCLSPGNPCAVHEACDETKNDCGCNPPAASGVGSRYVSISPGPIESTIPVALVITPDCPNATPLYVRTFDPATGLATLVTNPSQAVHLTPQEWGEVVYVSHLNIVPSTTYRVQTDCGTLGSPSLSTATLVTTLHWGDISGGGIIDGSWGPPDGGVNVLDMAAVVDAFRHYPGAPPIYRADQQGCIPDRRVDTSDMVGVVDAFRSRDFFLSSFCTNPCP